MLSLARVQAHYQKAFADLTPPRHAQRAGKRRQSAESSVTFAGAADAAAGDSSTVTLKVYAGSSATGDPAQTLTATRQGDNSYSVGTTLTNGQWTGQAEQQDASGNVGASSANTFVVDTAAPVTTIASGPASPTNQTSASFSFSANKPSTFTCSLDGAAFSARSSPQAYSSLAAGSHTFQARATDTAGNTGLPATYSWTIDTTPPPAPSINTPTPPNPSASTGARASPSRTARRGARSNADSTAARSRPARARSRNSGLAESTVDTRSRSGRSMR